jgi:ABC-type phosphate transport system substrate-binding protein
MRPRRLAALLVFIATFLTPCLAHHMAVVVNNGNNVGNIAALNLAKLFRLEIKKWPDGKVVVLVLHRNSVGETKTLERLNKKSDAEWKALITADKDSIRMADSDAEVLKIVRSTPGAVGFVDVRAIDSTVTVIRVEGKLPMDVGYLQH